MDEQSFGAFSWLWGGFGVGALCFLRAWDISVTSQKAAMARSCLSCSKQIFILILKIPSVLIFFFQT